jgi:hypothetical protein
VATLDGQRNDGEANESDWIKPDVEGVSGGVGPDLLVGNAGENTLRGDAGSDELEGGAGSDRLFGGANDDLIRTNDGVVDHVTCGDGSDRVLADPVDDLADDCELVDRYPGQPRPVSFVPWQLQSDERGFVELRIEFGMGPSSTPVTVSWSTQSHTATADSDYVSASGTYTFPAWETTGVLYIELIDDALDEPNEIFNLSMTTPASSAAPR